MVVSFTPSNSAYLRLSRVVKGFTLVELMIVVAIVGILSAIAYPSYQRYVINTKRADAMLELQNIGNRIEAEKMITGRYSDVELAKVMGSGYNASTFKSQFPSSNNHLYTITIWDISKNPIVRVTTATLPNGSWELRADPKADTIMKGDGRLLLNNVGRKCRNIPHKPKQCGMSEEWKQ